jgi:hypothetical protein
MKRPKNFKYWLLAIYYRMQRKRRAEEAAPIIVTEVFGTLTTNGGGNWGTNPNRAMVDRYALNAPVEEVKAKAILVHFRPESGAGTNIKGILYSALPDGSKGARIAVGSIVAVPAGGGWMRSEIVGQVLIASPASYWIGFVADNFQASADSGGQTSPNSELFNGDVSFTRPPETLPSPAATYANDLAVRVEYEYAQ